LRPISSVKSFLKPVYGEGGEKYVAEKKQWRQDI
jgi:hypothetical protein